MPELKSLPARNPLSIIALFISFIYGISAILLGLSVKSLTPDNQDRLIWFIIAFPVAVLGAFLLLVIGHHKKLYAPGDFRTDEGFLAGSTPPEMIGQKYLQLGDIYSDVAGGAGDVGAAPELSLAYDEAPEEVVGDEMNVLAQAPIIEVHPNPRLQGPDASQGYLLEGLVFQELQTALGSAISREIQLSVGRGRHLGVDGWIDSPPTIIEIETVAHLKGLKEKVSQTLSRLDHIAVELNMNTQTDARIVLAVLCRSMTLIPQAKMIAGLEVRNVRVTVDIRMFAADELLRKYGLQSVLASDDAPTSVS